MRASSCRDARPLDPGCSKPQADARPRGCGRGLLPEGRDGRQAGRRRLHAVDGHAHRRPPMRSTTIPTFFMQMLDINELSSPAAGQAEESVRNVEIVAGARRLGLDGVAPRTDQPEERRQRIRRHRQGKGRAEPDQHHDGALQRPGQRGSGSPRQVQRAEPHGLANVNCLEVPASTYSTPTLSRRWRSRCRPMPT